MPHYVVLTNYTQEGFETLGDLDAEEFLEQSKATIREHGGTLHDYYLTMGEYDAVVIVEFPDDHSYTEAVLDVLGRGIAETETLRAFTESEARDFVETMGD
jgi:uncharacterized protein with GYD domain